MQLRGSSAGPLVGVAATAEPRAGTLCAPEASSGGASAFAPLLAAKRTTTTALKVLPHEPITMTCYLSAKRSTQTSHENSCFGSCGWRSRGRTCCSQHQQRHDASSHCTHCICQRNGAGKRKSSQRSPARAPAEARGCPLITRKHVLARDF